MAAEHGSQADVYVDGYNLTAFLRNIDLNGVRDVSETSVFGSADKSFVAGLPSATISAEGVFDNAAGACNAILSAAFASSTVTLWTVYVQGETALGSVGYGMQTWQTSYNVSSPIADIVSIAAEGTGSPDRERLISLHPLAAETDASGPETSVDGGAATAAGSAGYLHVTAFTGTSIDIIIEHSSDNFAADTSTLITFTQVTAANAKQRVATSATAAVKRYTRVNWSSVGLTTCTFSVGLNRK